MDLFVWSSPEQMIALAALARRGVADRGHDALRVAMEQQMKAFGKVMGGVDRDDLRADVFATTRGDHIYLITVLQKGPSRSAEQADAAAAGLQLLD